MESEDAEWLRQLEAPRGRDGALMCVARWHPNEQLALVEREKGSDLHVFGVYKQGQLWTHHVAYWGSEILRPRWQREPRRGTRLQPRDLFKLLWHASLWKCCLLNQDVTK